MLTDEFVTVVVQMPPPPPDEAEKGPRGSGKAA
jgi:hypothetical protein